MKFDVKNTTKISILDILFPYACRGCGHLNGVLCDRCKKYIIKNENEFVDKDERIFMVGYREGVLKKLVTDYKYQAQRAVSTTLAGLVAEVVPEIDEQVCVVPLPTIERHIRERSFDHTKRVAAEIARLRGWKMAPVLSRVNKTVQVGSSEDTRKKQAKMAYAVNQKIDPEKTYLMFDDIWTTGASMHAAIDKMRAAGATKIYGMVICKGR